LYYAQGFTKKYGERLHGNGILIGFGRVGVPDGILLARVEDMGLGGLFRHGVCLDAD
jgi:hypothetical protein